ncbi:MAG: hypothetical protein H7070_00020 [Saprospiraceae bacterium]|nr:hypothetical protein [Pyrinomonadaceae bacterium]
MAVKNIKTLSESARQNKGKRLAAKGFVTRIGDGFRVRTSDSLRTSTIFIVRRDELGPIRCDCPAYKCESYVQIGFRCEHIMAVRYAIVMKNTEFDVRTSRANNGTLTTESRKSERGEQNAKSSSKIVSGDRHARNVDLDVFRLDKTRGKYDMKQNRTPETNANEIKEIFSPGEDQGNVLNFSSTLRELRKNVDPDLVRQREGRRDRNGKVQMVDYVEWHTVADILDQTAPNWAHSVRDIREVGNFMTVTVAITIDGVTREGIGTGLVRSEMGIKKAEHDALKRAAVKFGIARDLYKREFDAIDREETATPAAKTEFSADPVAQSISDLVTSKQLSMIRMLAREKSINADEECSALMNCKCSELTRRAASALIVHLQELTAQHVPMRRAG